MPDLKDRIEQHKIKMMVESVDLMKELRDEYLPQSREDVVILSAAEYEELLQKHDPNNQLAKLLKTTSGIFQNTRGCRPQLLFEGDFYVARDKYYSGYQAKSKSILKALTNYIEHIMETRKPMSETPIETSIYDYYYPPTVEKAVMEGSQGKKSSKSSE
jgi:hypothetical protein